MKGFDAFAGVIKSGGKTRRAAKMVILNAEHPGHRRVHQLQGRGREEGLGADRRRLRRLVHRRRRTRRCSSRTRTTRVRVTDEFMRAVLDDGEWQTRAVHDRRGDGHLQGARPDAADRRGHLGLRRSGHAVRHDGQRLAHLPEHGAHQREQPVLGVHVPRRLGVQPGVDQPDEVRRAKTASSTSAAFEKACRTFITAQEILVDNASYPTPAIEKNSHDYRPLGLGYANLGALLMSRGLPYDSDARPRLRGGDHRADARRGVRAVGARRARPRRAVPRLREEPRADAARDAQAPRRAQGHRQDARARRTCSSAPRTIWDECVELGEQHGYRNAQATVLAPTGTIGFMMDCDTTGVEPDIALVKYKKLVGGGMMKIVNSTVPMALDEARLHAGAGQGHHRLHRRERDDRGRAAPQGQGPARCSTARSSRRAARARSTTWATSR